jgi:hypothetical protein
VTFSPRATASGEKGLAPLATKSNASEAQETVRLMTNTTLARLVGGSPMAVALRLITVSFAVGFLLDAFGLDSSALINEAVGAARRIVEYGFSDLRRFGRILLTGAMVVVPVWIVLRLIDGGRSR